MERKIKILQLYPWDNPEDIRRTFSVGISPSILDICNLRVDDLGNIKSLDEFEKIIWDEPLGHCGFILTGSGDAPLTWGPSWVRTFGDKFLTKKFRWVYWLKKFIQQTTINYGIPFLGICWGHQVLARCFGATTVDMPAKRGIEVGLVPISLTRAGIHDPLFQGVPQSFYAYESHSREVGDIPRGSTLLATSTNTKIQAFRYANNNIWGIQFHPEYTPSGMVGRVEFWKNCGGIPKSQQVNLKMAGQGDDDTTRESKIIMQNFYKICLAFYNKNKKTL